ncbi:ribonuclease P protein component [Weeksellaceae bacterium TAE3-ERU29]|nr:ribonuclease P protein component [Weeksellaceae bacterium TAE3-ERU29]
MTASKLFFRKKSKLKSIKLIEKLFKEGKSYKSYPIKAIYLPLDELETSKIGVSVPKKLFKKAVDRNRVKRLIREAYRLNQFKLKKNYAIMFIYISGKEMDFNKIEKCIIQLLNQIEENGKD